MKGTEAANQVNRVKRDDLAPRKMLAQDSSRILIGRTVAICGHDDGVIEHVEIAVAGRQPLAAGVERPGKRKRDNVERFASNISRFAKKSDILLQPSIMLIIIRTANAREDRRMPHEPGELIDVSVRIVSRQVAVGKPMNTFGREKLEQHCLHV